MPCRKTQRAVGHDDRRIAEAVIDDFMPIKNQCRIGLRNTVMHHAENTVLVTHKIFIAGSNEFWIVNGWDAVSSHSAPKNFIGRYQNVRAVKAIPVVCGKRRGAGKQDTTDKHYMTNRYKELLQGHGNYASHWSLQGPGGRWAYRASSFN
jgi:hypothetical protein